MSTTIENPKFGNIYICGDWINIKNENYHIDNFDKDVLGKNGPLKDLNFWDDEFGELCLYDIYREIEINSVKYMTEKDWEDSAKNQHKEIRILTAMQGKCLDILVDDKDEDVQLEVILQGYGADKLYKSPYSSVRYEVASLGEKLEELVNDTDKYVKIMVANKEFGLDKFKNDSDPYIKEFACQKLKEIEERNKIDVKPYKIKI